MADQSKGDNSNSIVDTKVINKVKKVKTSKAGKNLVDQILSTNTAEQTLATLADTSDQFSKLINANVADLTKSAESVIASIVLKAGNKRKNEAVAAGSESNDESKSKHSCHHCKNHKSVSLLIYCTNMNRKNNKARLCHKKYCQDCLFNIYGQDYRTPESRTLCDDWKCPSCKLVCSCIGCVRARGAEIPVGIPIPSVISLPIDLAASTSDVLATLSGMKMKMPPVAPTSTPETDAISDIYNLMFKVNAQLNYTQNATNYEYVNKPHKDPIVIENVAALQNKLTEYMSRD